MSRYVVRHFDVRRGSIVRRHRFYAIARLRFAWLRMHGFSCSLTDTRTYWRVFS